MARFSTSTRAPSSALSMPINNLCTSRSFRCWTTHEYFHVLMIPLYGCGTCPHNPPSPPSSLTPTMSVLAKSPLPIHTSFSPVHMMARSASLTPAQANVNFSWVQSRGGQVLVPYLSNKYLCTHPGLLLYLLRGPSFGCGTSLQVDDVSVRCQTTRRRLHLSLLTPTRRGY